MTTKTKKKPGPKPAVLKSVVMSGATAEVPISMDTVLGITNRIAAALEAVERRYSGQAAADTTVPQRSEDCANLRTASPPQPSEEMPPVEILAGDLNARSLDLRNRTEALMIELLHGGNQNAATQALSQDPGRPSQGPTKDAILGAHTNLSYVEDHLTQIAAYLLGR